MQGVAKIDYWIWINKTQKLFSSNPLADGENVHQQFSFNLSIIFVNANVVESFIASAPHAARVHTNTFPHIENLHSSCEKNWLFAQNNDIYAWKCTSVRVFKLCAVLFVTTASNPLTFDLKSWSSLSFSAPTSTKLRLYGIAHSNTNACTWRAHRNCINPWKNTIM